MTRVCSKSIRCLSRVCTFTRRRLGNRWSGTNLYVLTDAWAKFSETKKYNKTLRKDQSRFCKKLSRFFVNTIICIHTQWNNRKQKWIVTNGHNQNKWWKVKKLFLKQTMLENIEPNRTRTQSKVDSEITQRGRSNMNLSNTKFVLFNRVVR